MNGERKYIIVMCCCTVALPGELNVVCKPVDWMLIFFVQCEKCQIIQQKKENRFLLETIF